MLAILLVLGIVVGGEGLAPTPKGTTPATSIASVAACSRRGALHGAIAVAASSILAIPANAADDDAWGVVGGGGVVGSGGAREREELLRLISSGGSDN